MTAISLAEAEMHLPELIEATNRGEEVVITLDETPVAKPIPANKPTRSGFGNLRGKIRMADDFDAPLADFEPYMQ